jgi:four helix bundle protein
LYGINLKKFFCNCFGVCHSTKVQETRHKEQDLIFEFKNYLSVSKELEDRFHNYAKAVRNYCTKVKWDIINKEYIKQVIRSSGSVSANYTEASDDLGKADEKMKIKISRREAKETIKWIDLILTYESTELEVEKAKLIDEGDQIRRILSAIINKLGG